MSKGPLKRDFLDNYLTTFSESVILEIQKLGGSPFVSKSWKFKLHFENTEKNWEKDFSFWYNCIRIGIVKLSLLRTWYFSSAANVLRSSPKIWHVNKRDFFELNFLASHQQLWARLPYCLSKDPLKRDFLDIYLATFSESVTSKIQNLWGSSFYSKCLKFNLDFKNAAKNWEKVFCFWDNCIWIGIVKLSLWRTRYFSSAANVLTSSPKIWHVNKRDFFWHNFLASDQWIWQRCCDADFNSAWAHWPYCLSKHPLKQDFLDIYLTTFSESVISEIQNLWGSSFISKYWKFHLDFINGGKTWGKVFCC